MAKQDLLSRLAVLSLALFCLSCNSDKSYEQEIKLARKCWEVNNKADAYKHLKNAVKIDPKNGEAFAYAGAYHFTSRHYNTAIKYYYAALKRNYEPQNCHFMRGCLHHITGKLRKAESDYQFALRSGYKDKSTIYVNLSDIYFRLGDRKTCRSYIDKALEISKDNLIARANRAELKFAEGAYAEALEEIECVNSLMKKSKERTFPPELIIDTFIILTLYKAELQERMNRPSEVKVTRDFAKKLIYGNLDFKKRAEKCKQVRLKMPNHLEAPRLLLYSDTSVDILDKHREQANRFLDFVDANYLPINSNFKPTFILFKTEKQYSQFCNEQFGRKYKLGGFYQASWDMLTLFLPNTLLEHELTHALSEQHLLLQEKWASEGLAELFGIAYVDDGKTQKLDLKRSYSWLNKKLKSKDVSLLQNVSCIVRMSKKRHESHLVATFLLYHNKLKAYLDLARKGCRKGYPTVFEAAFEKNMKELEPMWYKYLDEVFPNKID